MFALSSSLSAHVPSDCVIDSVVAEFFLKSFLFSKNSLFFLFPVLMFLEKKDCFGFLNIDVTLLSMPLYFLQSSVDPDDFALRNKVFPLLHCTF